LPEKEEAAGPAESAGKQIDNAVQNAGAQADSTADKAKEKLDEAGKKIDQLSTAPRKAPRI